MKELNLKGAFSPGIYNGLQKVSIPLFGVLSTALLAHKALTKSDMGVWVNFLAITTFVEMFRSGIVRTSLIKFINYSKKIEHREIMSAAFFLNGIISIISALLLFFFGKAVEDFLKSPGLNSMFHIYIITLLFLIFFSHIEWLMYAHLRFKALFYTYLVRQGGTFMLILVYYLIVGQVQLDMLVVIYTIGVIMGIVAGYIYMKSFFGLRFIYSLNWIRTLWNFGKYVFGSNIFTLIFRNADQFLLSNITANPGMVASQNISMRIINIADIPSQVIADILFPKNSSPELANRPEAIKSNYEKAVGAALSVILPFVVVLLLFPKLIITILVGTQYLDAVPYLMLITSAIFFQAFLKQTGVIFDSSGRPRITLTIATLIAIVQIVACYFFISRFALMGAGFALLTTHLFGFTLSQVLLKKYFKVNFLNSFKYCFQFYPIIFKLVSSKFLSKYKTANE